MKSYASVALASILSVVLYATCYMTAQPISPDIRASPSEISMELSKSVWGIISSPNLRVTINVQSLEPNASVVDIFADTFFEERGRWPPVSSEILNFSIKRFQLSNSQRTEIHVSLNVPADIHPGLYSSKIYITSSGNSVIEIPFSLKISESEFMLGFLISMGVMLNLLLFMIKDIVDERNKLHDIVDTTNERVTVAYDSICRAINEERLDDLKRSSNFILGQVEFEGMINDWNRATESNSPPKTFISIGKRAKRIESLMNGAKPVDPKMKSMPRDVPLKYLDPPFSYQTRKNPEDRFKINPVKDVVWRSENLQYIALILTFAIIVVNSWQTYLSDAIAFGASGLADYLAAVLFGFGSQTVLTQGVGMAKSWAESRVQTSS